MNLPPPLHMFAAHRVIKSHLLSSTEEKNGERAKLASKVARSEPEVKVSVVSPRGWSVSLLVR